MRRSTKKSIWRLARRDAAACPEKAQALVATCGAIRGEPQTRLYAFALRLLLGRGGAGRKPC